jgi:cytochrome P450
VIVIPAPFLHRDGAHLPWADHFAPWTWLDGRARESWSIVPFGAGPAGCPGRDVVLLTSSTFLAALIERHELRLPRPGPLDPRRPLPGTLDPAGFRFLVAPA